MSINHQFSDQELLQRLQHDDNSAFQCIFQYYWYKLYMVAFKRLRCKESSEEIVQNIFFRLWLNRKEMHVRGPLDAYLLTAVRYAVIDHLEKEATRKNIRSFTYYAHEDIANPTEEYLNLQELQLNIQKAIDLMPVKCQSVFILSRKEYRSNREIAGLLHISEKTVENHITNALKTVRTVLRKTGAFLFCFEISLSLTLGIAVIARFITSCGGY